MMKDILTRMQLDEINKRLSQLEVGEELNFSIGEKTWTHEDIGETVSLRYPQGTTFDTEIVEETCIVCGSHYIGPREEVAHLMAQHSIIHGNEAEQMMLSVSHMDSQEQREQFESHIVGMSHIYEAHPDMRVKIMTALQVCLSRFASIKMVGDE